MKIGDKSAILGSHWSHEAKMFTAKMVIALCIAAWLSVMGLSFKYGMTFEEWVHRRRQRPVKEPTVEQLQHNLDQAAVEISYLKTRLSQMSMMMRHLVQAGRVTPIELQTEWDFITKTNLSFK